MTDFPVSYIDTAITQYVYANSILYHSGSLFERECASRLKTTAYYLADMIHRDIEGRMLRDQMSREEFTRLSQRLGYILNPEGNRNDSKPSDDENEGFYLPEDYKINEVTVEFNPPN